MALPTRPRRREARRRDSGSRPRRSRFARWVVRPLIWSPAVLALVVGSLLGLLESEWFARRALSVAEEQAARYLGRQVEIGELSIDIVPLSIEAREVLIAGESGRRPFAEVESVRIEARIGSWVRPGITLERVFVSSPVIRITVDESGQHDAPRWVRRRPPDAPRRFDVTIDALLLSNGTLETEYRRYPLEISARNFSSNLTGGERFELSGQVRADEVTLVLPGAKPYLGTVSAFGSYRPGRVEVAEGRFDGPELSGRVEGSWEWRDRRQARFAIEATGQGRLLDRLGYGSDLVSGPFEFSGEFARGEREWSLAGNLTSPGVVVADRALQAVRGRVQVDAEGARYRVESARYGGGEVKGSVRMAMGTEENLVELDLELTGTDVNQILRDQQIPVTGLSAHATGAFSYQFPRSDVRFGNGWADFKIRSGPAAGGLPLDGSAAFGIGDGLLETNAVRLRGDDHEVLVSGGYDLRTGTGRFDIEVTTEAVEQVVALLPIVDAGSLWQPSRGRGSVRAIVELDSTEVRAATEVELESVVARGYSADRLLGTFEADSLGVRGLRAELLRPTGGLIVTGSVPLSESAGVERPLSIAVDAEGWPLSDIEPWLPFALPMTGIVSGGVTLEGSPESPRGTARGRVTAPRFALEVAAGQLDFDFDFSAELVEIRRAELAFGEGAARLRGRWSVAEDELALVVDSDRLALAELGVLPALPDRLSGALEVSGEVRGSIARPEFALGFAFEGVALDGRQLGDGGSGSLRLDWDGSRLRTEGGMGELLRIAGGGRLDLERADLVFDVSSDDLGSLLALVLPRPLPDFESSGTGQLTVTGSLEAGSAPALRLELDRVVVDETASRLGSFPGRKLENLEPVALALADGVVSFESVYLATPDGASEMFVAGILDLGERKSLDLKVQGSLAAFWLEPWLPDGFELAEGRLDGIGSVVGTFSDPRFDGVGEFTGGRVVAAGFPEPFEDAQALFLLYPGEVVVDRLSSKVAGGRLAGAGTVRADESGAPTYRFQFSGESLSFRYPEDWSVRGNADFTLASSPGGRQLSGALRIERALYVTDVPIELDQLLRSFFEQRRLEVEETDELLSTTQLNLAISADKTLRIRNNLADLRGSADLVLRGSLARPVVFGSVDLDPPGSLVYAGNTYAIERGQLTFANPYRLEPVIDLVAHTDMREYAVTLNLSGTPERLSFDFISDPPLAELEVMSLLTGGRPGTPELDPTRLAANREGENLGAEGFLYGQATSLVASRFNRLFGLDQFRIDPLTSSTGNLSSARITVGKQLSRDLSATYSYDPSETEQQIFELEWSVSRSLILVLTQNGDGTYAVDAKWGKAF